MMYREEIGRVVKYTFHCDAQECLTQTPSLDKPAHPDGWAQVRISTFNGPNHHVLEVGFDLCSEHADRMLELVGRETYAAKHLKAGQR